MRQVSSRCFVGKTITQFGATDFAPALAETEARNPTTIIFSLYRWDLIPALKVYAKLESAKDVLGHYRILATVAGESIR
jgi:hypothetical protein